jgi:hypothetical protein
MNKTISILLSVACAGFSSAYAFTPSQASCDSYVNNSNVTLSSGYFESNASNIQACLQACPTIYGSGNDDATLKSISQCKQNLNTLNFIGEYYLQNPQYVSDSNSGSAGGFSAPQLNMQNSPAATPQSPVSMSKPAAPAAPQNNAAKPSTQIKWF